MALIDMPTGVRQGEELDLQVLESFLKERVPGLQGTIQVSQFPSGASNLTYLVVVGDRRMVLRRPPFGTKPKSGHDMGREYRVLSALQPRFPYCPKPVVFCEEESVLGAPFYLMEQIEGIILRRDYPPELGLTVEQIRQQNLTLLDVFQELHAVDYNAIGLGNLGRPEGYCQRQVEGWSKRYLAAMTPDAADFDAVMRWLADRLPAALREAGGERACLIHNDYKFDNVIWDARVPTRLIGVLDWEMTTIGHPLMDLGSSLGYWIERDDPPYMQELRRMPTDAPGALTRCELVARYAEKSGITINNFDFFYVFGLFRLAVIVQQIYYRFYHGQTKDQRFRNMFMTVAGLRRRAGEIVETSEI